MATSPSAARPTLTLDTTTTSIHSCCCSPTGTIIYPMNMPFSPIPARDAERKSDFRAQDVDQMRFRKHVFRYGFTRRAGSYIGYSMKEKLTPPHPRVTPAPIFPVPPGKNSWGGTQRCTPAQRLLDEARRSWPLLGYRCPWCHRHPPLPALLAAEKRKEAREAMVAVRRLPPGGAFEWDDDADHSDLEVEDEGEGRRSEEVWGVGEGRWEGLVDRAVERWEGERRGVVEGLGWEVFTEGTAEEEGEWVDWDGVDVDVGSGPGEERERESVAGWTECGSEWE